jgi:hypothetical protein
MPERVSVREVIVEAVAASLMIAGLVVMFLFVATP